MKLDLTIIKNESLEKFTKSTNKVHSYFSDLLSLALDTAVHEIDNNKRKEVEMELLDIFEDEFKALTTSFTRCLNKASHLVESKLGG